MWLETSQAGYTNRSWLGFTFIEEEQMGETSHDQVKAISMRRMLHRKRMNIS